MEIPVIVEPKEPVKPKKTVSGCEWKIQDKKGYRELDQGRYLMDERERGEIGMWLLLFIVAGTLILLIK